MATVQRVEASVALEASVFNKYHWDLFEDQIISNNLDDLRMMQMYLMSRIGSREGSSCSFSQNIRLIIRQHYFKL